MSEIREVGSRNLVQLEGERESGQTAERRCKFVDGIVGPRQGTVAAAIGDCDLVVGVDLFGGLDFGDDRPPVLQLYAAGVGINYVGCIHQIAMLADEPVSAVELAAFFVGRERQDQVALRLISLAMQAQESLHQRGVGVLHVLRATAVEIAVLLDELKRVGGPIGAQSLDHVYVAKKKDGLFCRRSGSAEADYEILLALIGPEQANVLGRETSVEEAPLHGRGRGGDIALRRVSGVDLDEFFEDCQRLRAIGWRRRRQMVLCFYKRAEAGGSAQDGENRSESMHGILTAIYWFSQSRRGVPRRRIIPVMPKDTIRMRARKK